VNSYYGEQELDIKRQLLATIQNVRQRLLDSKKGSPEKKLLHNFYQTLLDRSLPPTEKEMALRGYIALSTNEEILSNLTRVNEPTLYTDMHPRVALGLKLELLHKSSDLEEMLIPDIINFLHFKNNAELEEVFNVYLVNRFIYAGINSMSAHSKAQIKSYLSAIKYKYLPNTTKTIDEHMSILSHGVWLEAFALAEANSIEDAKRDVIRFLSTMDAYNQKKYAVGLSSRLSGAALKRSGDVYDLSSSNSISSF